MNRARSDGRQATEQQLERPNPGNPDAGLQVTTKTIDIVHPETFGTQETRTIQVRNANGSFEIVSVDTRKSDKVIKFDIAQPDKPKYIPASIK